MGNNAIANGVPGEEESMGIDSTNRKLFWLLSCPFWYTSSCITSSSVHRFCFGLAKPTASSTIRGIPS
jgi:hypothetical protein